MYTFEYGPNFILILLQSGLGYPSMIANGLRSRDIPFFYVRMFMQVTMYCNSDLVVNFLQILYSMEWQPHLMKSLIVRMNRSISSM